MMSDEARRDCRGMLLDVNLYEKSVTGDVEFDSMHTTCLCLALLVLGLRCLIIVTLV